MHTSPPRRWPCGSPPREPFRARQRQTIANAQAFADGLEANGVPVLTGGTDVHLVLVDLNPTGLDGRRPRTGSRRSASPSTATRSRSTQRPPMNPSGLRIGTPALTTRGLVEEDMPRSPR